MITFIFGVIVGIIMGVIGVIAAGLAIVAERGID